MIIACLKMCALQRILWGAKSKMCIIKFESVLLHFIYWSHKNNYTNRKTGQINFHKVYDFNCRINHGPQIFM